MRIINDRPEIWPFILISLLVHILIIILIPMMVTVPRFEEKVVEIFPVTEDFGKAPFRIADIDEPEVQKRPKKPKFIGMYDSSVSEETVADGRVGTGSRGEGKRGDGLKRGSKQKKAVAERGKKKLFAFDKNIFEEKSKNAMEEGSEGGSPSGDFFPDFRRGNRTYLNVERYPGVDYFVRLKRAFRITFNPEPSLRDYFSSNRVSRGSVDVVIGVSVSRAGELAEIFVFRSSGIPSYDEEALRTIRASAPFSKPPEKFTDDDGLLRMSWTFTVYL